MSKPLGREIVWDDLRTLGIVTHFENLLELQGIDIHGKVCHGKDGTLGGWVLSLIKGL